MNYHDQSMPEKYAGTPAAKLWERQGPLTEDDDGKGTYTYCWGGNSHCLDSFCPCRQTFSFRIMYLIARGCRNPLKYLFVAATSPLIVIIAAATIYWVF